MRFLVIFSERAAARKPSGEWQLVLDEEDVRVWVREVTAQRAHERPNAPLLLGRVQTQSPSTSAVACRTAADVCRRFWGRYVALVKSESAGSWSVLRDPSGGVPCFTTDELGARLVFSHIEDAIAAGWKSRGPDWRSVASLVQSGRIRDGRTGLLGVTEVLPGQSIDLAGNRVMHWSPRAFVDDVVEDRAVAKRMLRDAIDCSVEAVGRSHERIMHLLSGGLDSSLVLASLRRTVEASRIKCLTFTQGDASELDEVRYAQLVADRYGVELSVARFDASRVRLERASEQVSQPRPLGYTFSIDNDDAELEFADASGASVCTSGAGGDGLFYQLRTRTYCADYLLRHGPSWGAARVAFDNARLARVSLWTCLREGWKFAYGGASFSPEQAVRNPYLCPDIDEPQTSWVDVHPWFEGAERLSPGKKLHLWTVLDCLNLFYPYRRSVVANTELPLVSQPIIETVLRIPSWVLSNGGRDRTLVREACEDILPAPILSRSGKGAMDGYYAELCAANAAYLREALLDGVLVERGILNRDALEHDLPRGRDPRDGRELPLLQAFAAEVWASAWSGTPAVAAS